MKPNHRVISFLVFIVAALSIVLFSIEGTNPINEGDITDAVAADQNARQFDRTEDRIIYSGDPPYLAERPILDGNLYVNHVDDYLLLGGDDISQIKYNAVSRGGSKATVLIQDNALAVLMSEEPYIEFSYKEKYYSLQILSRPYRFILDFRELSESTASLEDEFSGY